MSNKNVRVAWAQPLNGPTPSQLAPLVHTAYNADCCGSECGTSRSAAHCRPILSVLIRPYIGQPCSVPFAQSPWDSRSVSQSLSLSLSLS